MLEEMKVEEAVVKRAEAEREAELDRIREEAINEKVRAAEEIVARA